MRVRSDKPTSPPPKVKALIARSRARMAAIRAKIQQEEASFLEARFAAMHISDQHNQGTRASSAPCTAPESTVDHRQVRRLGGLSDTNPSSSYHAQKE
ncbi:hypothetical protein CF319_g7625 [Tilletia indica]|nr:hypothetical protein CF319_g7625 [Tilletia indica]